MLKPKGNLAPVNTTNAFILMISVLLMTTCLMFPSCRNSMDEINALNYRDTLPMESAQDVEMIYSDSARIMALLKGSVVNRYAGTEPYIVLPEGIKVYFYDSLMNVKTFLRAGYAIKYERSDLMEARNDVVVINSIGEKLNTEHLIWDQNRRVIYTNVFVKITRKDEILLGDGMEADENFDKWIIKKPKGSFFINIDEDSTNEEEMK
jgi:LPS export ABC transporter protein LptC